MKISFDPAKRAKTLKERRLDFVEAPEVFAGLVHTLEDDRFDYGETRWITYGRLRGNSWQSCGPNVANIAISSR